MELTQLGRYTIRCKLGEGGMATVHRAWDPESRRDVAIKVLRPELILDGTFLQRFKREMEVTWKLNHPNIVRVFDAGHDQETGLYFFVMELLDGITAYDAIFQKARVSLDVAVRILLDILSALGHAHGQGLIHRDLKLENIMLCRDGRVVLTDFGVARPEGSKLTRVSQRVGTPIYMAPEQVKGEEVDHRTDLYACGVAFFELVTGRLPFEGKDDIDTSHLHVTAPPPRPSSICREVPDSVDRVFLKTMAKGRDARWQSAHAMAEALKNAMAEAGWTVADRIDPDGLPKWPPLPKPSLSLSRRDGAQPMETGTSPDEFDELLAPPTPQELGVAVSSPSRRSWWKGPLVLCLLWIAFMAWLRLAHGYVTVTSYPTGASVTAVELARWGRTPISMRSVGTGSYRLRLQSQGFADRVVTFEAEPGRMSNLHVILEPLGPGKVLPSGAGPSRSTGSSTSPSVREAPSSTPPSVRVASSSTSSPPPVPRDELPSPREAPPRGPSLPVASAIPEPTAPTVTGTSPSPAVEEPRPGSGSGSPLEEALRQRVRVLLAEGRDGEAVSALRGACKTALLDRGEAAGLLEAAGRHRMDQGRLEASAELLKWALRLDFTHVKAHLDLSRVFEKQGQFERTAFHLRKALGLAKSSSAYGRERASMEAKAASVTARKDLLDQASLLFLEKRFDLGMKQLARAAGAPSPEEATEAQRAFMALRLLDWGRRFAEDPSSRIAAPWVLREAGELATAKTDAYEALALAYLELEENPKAYYFLRKAVESLR